MRKELDNGDVWVTGDEEDIGKEGCYFKIGRKTEKPYSDYDEGKFSERSLKDYPSTHAVLHLGYQVLAICHRRDVATNTNIIAKHLESMFQDAQANEKRQINVEIDPIVDSQSFVDAILEAEAVTRFSFTIKRPNHWDRNENVVKPMEGVLQELDADEGEATYSGRGLDQTKLDDIVRSVSSSGGKAEAFVVESADAKPVKRSLGKDQLIMSVPAVKEESDKVDVLGMIVGLFQRNRFGASDRNSK